MFMAWGSPRGLGEVVLGSERIPAIPPKFRRGNPNLLGGASSTTTDKACAPRDSPTPIPFSYEQDGPDLVSVCQGLDPGTSCLLD